MIKPFVKWVGGKTRLLPELIKRLPPEYGGRIPDNVFYYEPFVGGGAMLFALQPRYAMVNDINLELITAYRAVTYHPDKLIKRLMEHTEHVLDEAYYLKVRAMDRAPGWRDNWWEEDNVVEHAARLLYLNKTCFNGMYRENKDGFFNVPYGYNWQLAGAAVDRDTIFDDHMYLSVHDVAAYNMGYQDFLDEVFSDNFYFIDPPYDGTYNQYGAARFDKGDQCDLANCVHKIDRCGAKFMLTNSDTPLIRKLYSCYNIHELKAPQLLAAKTSARVPRNELIITNY